MAEFGSPKIVTDRFVVPKQQELKVASVAATRKHNPTEPPAARGIPFPLTSSIHLNEVFHYYALERMA